MAARVPVAKALAILALLATLSSQAIGQDKLFSGSTLTTGQSLVNGPYTFIIQDDCNLVLYVNSNTPLWDSGTEGMGTNCIVTLQTDGTLVVFTGDDASVWTSGTTGATGNYILVVQSDGNVVIYVIESGQYGPALWSTDTVQSGNRKRLL